MWCAGSGEVGRLARLDEGVTRLVGDAGEVELERESLLVPVAALHVDGVDAVERFLGPSDDAGALGGDLGGQRQRRGVEVAHGHDRRH
jgi:hypothetical protein